jgi:hypothetical protein
MSTILNSSDDNINLNQNTFSKNFMGNEHQQIDSSLTKKILTGQRGKISEKKK